MKGNHPLPSEGADIFTQRVEPDRPAASVNRELLRTPQIVKYIGPRYIEYEKDGAMQKTKKQLFQAQAGHGPWFAVWGTLNLDSQLRQLRLGALIRLRYLGQDENAEADRKPHLWEVSATSATPAAVDKLRAAEPWPSYEAQLLAGIEQAKAEDQARRDARQAAAEVPPPDQDDDLPF